VDHLRRYRVDEADVLVGLAYDEPGDSTVRSQLLAEADAAYRAAEAAPGTWPTNAAISASRIYYVTGAQGDDGRARAELTDLFGRLPADDDALDQVAEHLSWTLLNRFGDEGRTALFELLRSRADDSVEVRVELIVQLLDHAAWNLALGTRTQGEALVTEANAAAERASQIHPGYSQPHALRCRAHLLLGDFANAADACDAALDRYGKSFEEAGWHGVDLASAATDAVEAADNESAMQIVRIIARTRPDDPDAVASDLIAVATSFRQADQLTEAQEVLRIAHEQAEPLS
jgi:tetratricopeptide (TPR) repeat protein